MEYLMKALFLDLTQAVAVALVLALPMVALFLFVLEA
jgi:hypothetical protein